MWRLANMEGGGVTWVQVLKRIEAMKAQAVILPTDELFLKKAQPLAAQQA